jgi:hypothetical protein
MVNMQELWSTWLFLVWTHTPDIACQQDSGRTHLQNVLQFRQAAAMMCALISVLKMMDQNDLITKGRYFIPLHYRTFYGTWNCEQSRDFPQVTRAMQMLTRGKADKVSTSIAGTTFRSATFFK